MYNLIHECLSKEEGALAMVEKLNGLGLQALFTRVEVPTRPELDGVPPGKGYQFTLVALLGGYAVTQWRTVTMCADPGLALTQIKPLFIKWIQEFVCVHSSINGLANDVLFKTLCDIEQEKTGALQGVAEAVFEVVKKL